MPKKAWQLFLKKEFQIGRMNKYYITAPRLFDGEVIHKDWALVIENNKIVTVGSMQQINVPDGAVKINYPNADVALNRAINEGVIIGPRLIVAGRGIVSTGSYGPKGYDTDQDIMLGQNLLMVII